MGLRGAGAALLAAATLLALAVPAAATHLHAAHNDHTTRQQALQRLQEVFELPGPSQEVGTHGGRRVREAPEFMLELQRRIAHPDGVLRTRSARDSVLPHGAQIVRSFFEQGPNVEHLLQFNVSIPDTREQVLGAELRIFRVRRPRLPLLLRVYQVEAGRGLDAASADQHRLLGVQAARAGAPAAWHVFNVLPAVRAWLAGTAPNLGLLVTATTLSGAPARGASALARRGGRHAPRRQPLLVLYDGFDVTPTETHAAQGGVAPQGIPDFVPPLTRNGVHDADTDDYEDEDYDEEQNSGAGNGNPLDNAPRGRERRETTRAERLRRRRRRRRDGDDNTITQSNGNTSEIVCTRHDLYVDFMDIGWNSWIIAPRGYNAYQCVGKCPFPLGPAHQPTNHATVQSIMRHISQNNEVSPPCCTPLKLLGISIMFMEDDSGDIVLKLYDDMVAGSCGCQ